jgi:hypothetical protein
MLHASCCQVQSPVHESPNYDPKWTSNPLVFSGHQLGYLSGCLSGIEAMGKANPDFLSARSQKLLAEAMEQLRRFPRASPQDPALQGAMDGLQSKFKSLVASLGVLPEFLSGQQPSLEF